MKVNLFTSYAVNRGKAEDKLPLNNSPKMTRSMRADEFVPSKRPAQIQFGIVKEYAKLPEIMALKTLKSIPCPFCGGEMLIPAVLKDLANMAKDKTPREFTKDALSVIESYQPAFFDVEKKVFSMVQQYIEKHPGLSFHEIMVALKSENLEFLCNHQLSILGKIDNEAQKLTAKQKNSVMNLTEETRWVINENENEYLFKRQSFLNKMHNILIKMPKNATTENISRLCESLPSSLDSVSAFVATCGSPVQNIKKMPNGTTVNLPITDEDIMKRNVEIAQRFLLEEVISVEHSDAQFNYKPSVVLQANERYREILSACSSNNNDSFLKSSMRKELDAMRRRAQAIADKKATDISKLYMAHRRCNSLKGHKDLRTFIEEERQKGKDVVRHTHESFRFIIDAINKGKISNCDNYPVKLRPTLYYQTDGLIDLDLSDLNPKKRVSVSSH